MLKLILQRRTAIVATTAALLGLSTRAQATGVGQPAPDFTLTDVTGKPVRLSDFRGRHVVLEWTNPGCPFVRKHYGAGNMQSTQKDAMDKGVVWLAINSTESASADYLPPRELAAWKAGQKSSPTAILMDADGTVGRAYSARTTPHMYIIDPRGRLIYTGAIDSIPSARPDDIPDAINYVKAALAESLAGKPVSNPSTRPYGCSIKYKSAA